MDKSIKRAKMKVTTDKENTLGRTLTLSIPAADIDKKVDAEIQKISKTVRLPGFRPGKVPLKVVKQRFSDMARNDVLGQLIQDHLFEALKKEKLNPVDTPEIDLTTNEPGKDLEITAKFEVFPEITIKDLNKINVEKPVVALVDKDVDSMLETLQKQHVDWKKTDKAAKDGDRVMIDYEGRIDGNTFEGGTSSNVPLVLGSKSMIDGFESGLVGIKQDQTRKLNLAFPKDYHAKDFAGKKVIFSVTAHEVQQSELPKLDKAFAERFGADSLSKLREETKASMQKELEQQLKSRVKNQVMDGLLKTNALAVPAALIGNEIKRMQAKMAEQFSQGNQQVKMPEIPADMFKEEAFRRVNLGLLINHLIEENKLVASESKVQELITEMTSVYDNPQEIINYITSDKQRMADIKYTVLEEQVVDLILKSATLKDKRMGFSELMNPEAPKPAAKTKKSKAAPKKVASKKQ